MLDVDEGKAALDFRVGCHRHQPRSLHCPRNCSLSLSLSSLSLSLSLSLFLSLSLSLSLSFSLSRMQTHTRTHDGTIAAAHFFHVLFRTYRVACFNDVRLALSFHCDTHRHSLFFQARVCSLPLFHPLTKFFSNQRKSFFTSVKGLAKSKSRSTHARTRPRPPNCQLARHNKREYEITPRWRLAVSLPRHYFKKKKPRNQN